MEATEAIGRLALPWLRIPVALVVAVMWLMGLRAVGWLLDLLPWWGFLLVAAGLACWPFYRLIWPRDDPGLLAGMPEVWRGRKACDPPDWECK